MPKPKPYNQIKFHKLPKSTLTPSNLQNLLLRYVEFESIQLLPNLIDEIKALAAYQQRKIKLILTVQNLCSMTITHTCNISDTSYKISMFIEMSPTHFHTELIAFCCCN